MVATLGLPDCQVTVRSASALPPLSFTTTVACVVAPCMRELLERVTWTVATAAGPVEPLEHPLVENSTAHETTAPCRMGRMRRMDGSVVGPAM